MAGRGQDRRHRGRGRHGQVAARRRVRPERARGAGCSWPSASARSFGTNTATSSGARSGGGCSASRTTVARATSASGRGDADRHRPGARRARAAAGDGARRRRSPRHDLTSALDAEGRKASLEDLLVTCLRARTRARAGRRWSSRTATGSTRCRATCSRWSAAARRAFPSSSCSPIGRRREPGRRARDRAPRRLLARSRSTTSTTTEASLLIRSKLAQVLGVAQDPAAGDAGRARDGSRRGQSVLHRGARQLHRRPGRGPVRRGGDPRRRSCRRACTAWCWRGSTRSAEGPRRTLKVASVIGRVFQAPTLPRRLPGARRPRRGRRAARRAARASTS